MAVAWSPVVSTDAVTLALFKPTSIEPESESGPDPFVTRVMPGLYA